MKKKTLMFLLAGAAGCIMIVGAVLIATNPFSAVNESVPEFVMPHNTTASMPESSLPDISGSADTTSSLAGSPAAQPTTEPEPLIITKDTMEHPESHPETAETPDPAETTVPAISATTAASATTTAAQQTSTASTPREEPVETTTAEKTTSAESSSAQTATTGEDDISELPENVMLTSNDPLHYIRFEFGKELIQFEGVYEGDYISSVGLFRPNRISYDLKYTGSVFSGSLDISLLKPGYYIIRVLPENGLMDYVFEITDEGSRPLRSDQLPAAENLHAAASPLELPEEGVLQNITTSGDRKKAAEILAEIKRLSDEICAGLSDDYDKARALAVWVSLNMYYDNDAAKNGVTEDDISLEHVLEYHRSVCFGWTNLYSALCQAQGIECYNASGSCITLSRCFMQTTTEDERSHSWNMVVIDGRQIWVDTVWNSGNTYSNHEYSDGARDMQYFDITNNALAQDHRVTRFEHRDYFALS